MPIVLLSELPSQERAVLRLIGPDAERFVQGTFSADMEGLEAGQSRPSALCTVKGKIVVDVVVVRGASDSALDLLVPAAEADAVAQSLDDHIIMDDVEVSRLPDTVALSFQVGHPGASTPEVPDGVRVFEARHPAPGTLLIGPAPALAQLADTQGEEAVTQWARHRIATATPAWGHEIEAGVFPPEVGFVYGVSFDKGCFLGQEPLARIHARGQVNRVLARVRASAPLPVPAVLSADDREDAGRLTTLALAADGSHMGLAIVRRSHAKPGQALKVGEVAVDVMTGALGDDPGTSGRKSTGPVKLGRR